MAYLTRDPPTTGDSILPPDQPPAVAPPTEERHVYLGDEKQTTIRAATAGTSLELVAGVCAVVLAIIGLSGYWMFYTAAIAVIVIGVGLVAEGGAIASRWADVTKRLGTLGIGVNGGVGAQVFAGIAGVVLGILLLVHVGPLALLPIAAIVLGASVMFGSTTEPQIAGLVNERDSASERITRETTRSSGGAMIVAGLGAAVLGILALIHVGPLMTLSLVALLAIGASLVFGGGALTARFARRLAT